MSEHTGWGCCDICNDLDCDIDHEPEEFRDDDWMLDGSGIVEERLC